MKNNRIRELREEKGLTLKQLAEGLGVTYATISRYETGVVKTGKQEIWQKLARFFHVDISFLQGYTDIRDTEMALFNIHQLQDDAKKNDLKLAELFENHATAISSEDVFNQFIEPYKEDEFFQENNIDLEQQRKIGVILSDIVFYLEKYHDDTTKMNDILLKIYGVLYREDHKDYNTDSNRRE